MRETLPLGGHALYDRLVARALRAFYARIAARMQGPKILDVGCGPGHLAGMLHAMHPDAQVIGVDLDPRQLRIARKVAPDVEFRVGDSRDLEFEDNCFDSIITTESFHHWVGQEQAVQEIYRVLKPGGTFWIVEGAGDLSKLELGAWLERKPFPGLLTITRMVFRTHGYTTQALHDQVIPVIDASPFGGCEVERLDGWWLLQMRKP